MRRYETALAAVGAEPPRYLPHTRRVSNTAYGGWWGYLCYEDGTEDGAVFRGFPAGRDSPQWTHWHDSFRQACEQLLAEEGSGLLGEFVFRSACSIEEVRRRDKMDTDRERHAALRARAAACPEMLADALSAKRAQCRGNRIVASWRCTRGAAERFLRKYQVPIELAADVAEERTDPINYRAARYLKGKHVRLYEALRGDGASSIDALARCSCWMLAQERSDLGGSNTRRGKMAYIHRALGQAGGLLDVAEFMRSGGPGILADWLLDHGCSDDAAMAYLRGNAPLPDTVRRV
jgi:hypothetical protein